MLVRKEKKKKMKDIVDGNSSKLIQRGVLLNFPKLNLPGKKKANMIIKIENNTPTVVIVDVSLIMLVFGEKINPSINKLEADTTKIE